MELERSENNEKAFVGLDILFHRWLVERAGQPELLAIVVLANLWHAVVASEDLVVEENVTYGKAGDIELKLDVARPKVGSEPYPAIIFIHGEAGAGGERSSYRSSIERAARKGYVAATISSRLTEFEGEGGHGIKGELADTTFWRFLDKHINAQGN